jgi:transcription antitermination factor NusG
MIGAFVGFHAYINEMHGSKQNEITLFVKMFINNVSLQGY